MSRLQTLERFSIMLRSLYVLYTSFSFNIRCTRLLASSYNNCSKSRSISLGGAIWYTGSLYSLSTRVKSWLLCNLCTSEMLFYIIDYLQTIVCLSHFNANTLQLYNTIKVYDNLERRYNPLLMV